MGDRLQVGNPSWYVASHPGQLSLAIPQWVGAMSTGESWDVNRHTALCTSPVSVVWQCKLVSGWGLMKRRSAPLYGPYGSGRTLLYVGMVECNDNASSASFPITPTLLCSLVNEPIDHNVVAALRFLCWFFCTDFWQTALQIKWKITIDMRLVYGAFMCSNLAHTTVCWLVMNTGSPYKWS